MPRVPASDLVYGLSFAMRRRDHVSGFATDPNAPLVIPSPPGELEVGQVIGDRYEIRGRLGAGGMGAVWRAYDRELEEEIALKVLSPTLVGTPSMIERLRREARIARRISHANVCRVFDFGEVDGTHFLTMELVEGRTLRARLSACQIDPDLALAMVEQIAAGLSVVHKHGVVHGDVKPENIMVRPDDTTVLMDFGLARWPFTDEASTTGAAGTPAYMSPEQLRGEPLDPRSDIFSLGMIAFELLSGKPAFDGATTASRASSILRDPPRRLAAPTLPPEVVSSLNEALIRALARTPDDRFQSAATFAAALSAAWQPAPGSAGSRRSDPEAQPPRPSAASTGRVVRRRLLGGLLLVATVAALSVGWQRLQAVQENDDRGAAAPTAPIVEGSERVGIVVAPFDNLTKDASWDALAAGAAESIRAGLRTLQPVALRDAHQARPTTADARALGVTWIVTGSVQRVGERLRLAAQFIPAADVAAGEPIEVDGDPANPSALLEALRQRAIDEARLLHRDHYRRRRAISGTRAPAARDLLLQYYTMIGPAPRTEHLDAGMRRLTEALTTDPDYAPALVERAYLQALGAGARTAEERIEAALADVDRALAVRPEDAPARVMRCRLLQLRVELGTGATDDKIAAATQACGAALEADPSSAHVRLVFSRLHDRRCQDDKAMESLQRAYELDRSLTGRSLKHLVELALQNNRLRIADSMSKELTEFEQEERHLGARALSWRAGVPPTSGAYLLRGATLTRRGKVEEARAAFTQQLSYISTGAGDRHIEAAALRGLIRLASASGAAVPRDMQQRLTDIERDMATAVEQDVGVAAQVAAAYQWTDPEAAVTWMERLGRPSRSATCDDALRRALFYLGADRREDARRALLECTPKHQWEQSCVAWLRARSAR